MNLLDILSPESTIVDLKGESKEDIISELVNSLVVGDAITDRDQVLQAVLDREKIMSTGIGDGIAIPHGKSAAVTELVAAMGTQRRGVDFDALDGEPAFVFCWFPRPMSPAPTSRRWRGFRACSKTTCSKRSSSKQIRPRKSSLPSKLQSAIFLLRTSAAPSPPCSSSIPRSSLD